MLAVNLQRYFILRLLLPLSLIVICHFPTSLSAEGLSLEEYSLKAAFIFNAVKYTVFPKEHETVNVCTFDNREIIEAFKTVF